jgi:hypothetical protein
MSESACVTRVRDAVIANSRRLSGARNKLQAWRERGFERELKQLARVGQTLAGTA